MNLADAIRRASMASAKAVEEDPSLEANHAFNLVGRPEGAVEPHNDLTGFEELNFEGAATDRQLTLGDPNSGGMMRLELFLAPDQLHRLFRYVASTQHSVMTLREAASHLRITPASLEQMATERQIPAFQVDGKWRFSRARLEDWLTQTRSTKEQVS